MKDATGSLPTLDSLLHRPELGLRLNQDPLLPAAALRRGVQWVHGSDLPDPTPFLTGEVVLMTTGTQYAAEDAQGWDGYVRRLVAADVTALGFGTEVVRDGVPAPLAAACSAHGLPLFEIPFRTPFIAVARANADAVSELAYARRAWALGAQRAISRAALGPDGIAATVKELAAQLGVWVGLFDAAGELGPSAAPSGKAGPDGGGSRGAGRSGDAVPDDVAGLRDAARDLLRRGRRAAGAVRGTGSYTLQTVGHGGRLRGVLAVGLERPDHQEQAVLASVLAMLGLASEQDQALLEPQLALRSAIMHLLRTGSTEAARRVASAAGTPLPAAPVTVAVGTDCSGGPGAVIPLPATGAGQGSDPGTALVLPDGEETPDGGGSGMVIVAETAAVESVLAAVRTRVGGRWGLSAPCDDERIPAGEEEARTALRRGTGDVTAIEDVARPDLLLAAAGEDAVTLASAVLRPLREHDATHGTTLLPTLRTWLRDDANHEAAARDLGVHRHTVRARLRTAEDLLGRRLDAFPVRAELWTALRLAGEPLT